MRFSALVRIIGVGGIVSALGAMVAPAPASEAWRQLPGPLARITPPEFRAQNFDVTKFGAKGEGQIVFHQPEHHPIIEGPKFLKWDGWDCILAPAGGVMAGEPVLRHAKPKLPVARIAIPATSDEFSSSSLALQWQWPADPREDWYSLAARDGWLRLYAQNPANLALERVPNLLLQKFPARVFACETLLDFSGAKTGDEAGLAIVGRTHAAIALRRAEQGLQIVLRTVADRILATIPDQVVRLFVAVREGGVCSFMFADATDEWISTGADFHAEAGVWIGAKVGLYCLAWEPSKSPGHADIDWFRFSTLQT